MLLFILGIVVGVNLGVLCSGLLFVSKRADEEAIMLYAKSTKKSEEDGFVRGTD